MAYATINGTVQIYGGYIQPGLYDATENLDNMSTLDINGTLTVGGSAEVDLHVDGSSPSGWCDRISSSQTEYINPNQGNLATLAISTWKQSPLQNYAYSLIWSENQIAGHPFGLITNFGYQATWNPSPIPGYNQGERIKLHLNY